VALLGGDGDVAEGVPEAGVARAARMPPELCPAGCSRPGRRRCGWPGVPPPGLVPVPDPGPELGLRGDDDALGCAGGVGPGLLDVGE
jgi:hypothetical protein